MLQAEKVHSEFMTVAMYSEQFYDGTDMSGSDAKPSNIEDDVSDVSKGKWAFKWHKVGRRHLPLPLHPMFPHSWKCLKMRGLSSER